MSHRKNMYPNATLPVNESLISLSLVINAHKLTISKNVNLNTVAPIEV